jgi:hypothetical protein
MKSAITLELASGDAQLLEKPRVMRRREAKNVIQNHTILREVEAMCDYSLEHYQSRPAVQGEEYVSNRFPSGSIGFVVPGDQSVAVCMACDMRLRLAAVPIALQTRLGVSETDHATFTQFSTGLYRDAVRFDNGQAVTLQELGTGVHVWVVDALNQRAVDLGPQRRTEEKRPAFADG